MSTKAVINVAAKQPAAASIVKRLRPANREIAARAYELFLLRGGSHGSDVDDWLQAERELAQRN